MNRFGLITACIFCFLQCYSYGTLEDDIISWTAINFKSERKAGHFIETRMRFGDVLAMDTSLHDYGNQAIFLRQVSDGTTLLQLVYHHQGLLINCDIRQDHPHHFDSFKRVFWRSSKESRSQSNSSLVENATALQRDTNLIHLTYFKREEELADIDREMVDMKRLKTDCLDLKEEVKESFLNTQFMQLPISTSNNGGTDNTNFDDVPISRSKRISLIYPSTKWCGAGDIARHSADLGNYGQLDSCCREHDRCDAYIPPLTTAYNYFNYGLTTLSHCDCDSRFYECLKTIACDDTDESDAAQMVGQMFFNVMGKSCFLFRYRRVCEERSYWGWCNRYKDDYVAEIMDAQTF